MVEVDVIVVSVEIVLVTGGKVLAAVRSTAVDLAHLSSSPSR